MQSDLYPSAIEPVGNYAKALIDLHTFFSRFEQICPNDLVLYVLLWVSLIWVGSCLSHL